MSKEWMKDHGWFCDIEKLKNLLSVEGDIIVAVGMITNQDEYLDWFDKIFLLQCNEETFLNRLDTRTSNNFGKHPLEKEHVLSIYRDFENNLLRRGAMPINAEETIDVVVNNIFSKI
jgi:hypothetical protein